MNKIIKILFFISVLFSFQNLIAQTQPSGILFQAVARDASNNAAVNRTIYAIVEIREVTSTGSTVYSESHQVLSNDEGIFNLIIGNGTRLSGATKFDNLNWRSQIYFINLKVAIAPSLPTPGWDLSKEYVDMGTSQIWAVPYAFSAFKAVIADSATKFGGVLAGESGGTGINNIGKTITLGRNFEIQGLGNLKFNTTGLTSLTLPQNGRLINTDGVDTLSNKYIISPILLGKPTTPTADSLSSDSSIANIKYVKASISNQIAVLKGQISGVIDSSSGLRLKTSDTAVMLSNRIERDTISLSNRINKKVNTLNARVDSSLYVNGKVRIDSVLTLNDSLRVVGNVLIDSNLTIKGKLSIDGGFNFRDSLTVARGARIDSSLLIKGKLILYDSLQARGNAVIDNNLLVNQKTRLNDSLTVMGVTRLNDSLTVRGRTRINDSLLVRGNVMIDNDLIVNGKLSINGGFDFQDSLTVTRGARIDSSLLLKGKLLLGDSLLANGNARISNNLFVTGNTNTGTLSVTSALTVDGNVFVKGLNVSDSLTKFSTTKLNAVDTASLSNRIDTVSARANKFTADLKVNYGGGSFGKYTNGQTIPAIGKTIDEVFYDILTTVIPPTYTRPSASLSMGYSGNLEIGTNLGTLTFAPTYTQNRGGAFSNIDYKKGGVTIASNNGSPSVTDAAGNLTTAISYSVTYTYAAGTTILKNNIGQDDVTNQVTAGTVNSNTVTITPATYKYWGMSTNSSANITDADIIAMVGGNKEWATSKLKSSFTITGPGGSGPVKYAFYAVPSATSGTITSILAGGFESIAAFDKVTRNFTNAQGYVVSYDIYVQKNSGTDNVTLIIN